jgi:hypothetical protein
MVASVSITAGPLISESTSVCAALDWNWIGLELLRKENKNWRHFMFCSPVLCFVGNVCPLYTAQEFWLSWEIQSFQSLLFLVFLNEHFQHEKKTPKFEFYDTWFTYLTHGLLTRHMVYLLDTWFTYLTHGLLTWHMVYLPDTWFTYLTHGLLAWHMIYLPDTWFTYLIWTFFSVV